MKTTTEEAKRNATIEALLQALKEAHEAKDTKQAKKLRKQLRKEGYYISREDHTAPEKEAKTKKEEPKKEKKAKAKTSTKTEEEMEEEENGQKESEEDEKDRYAEMIRNAKTPQQVFGFDATEAKKRFRMFSKMFHPDVADGYEETMKKVNALWSKFNGKK